MTLLDRVFAGDEELGKKNDDHRPRRGTVLPFSLGHSIPPFRRRRYFYGVVTILFIFLFLKNIPTDLGPNSQRGDSRVPRRNAPSTSRPTPPTGEAPRPKESSEAQNYYYDGPIRFYKLAVSLHAVAGLAGYDGANKNVLFAASGLKSASELIPLACEMAKLRRNDVHFVLMGRDDLEVEEIKKLNGISSDCKIHWHGMVTSPIDQFPSLTPIHRCPPRLRSLELKLENGSQRRCKSRAYPDLCATTSHHHRPFKPRSRVFHQSHQSQSCCTG